MATADLEDAQRRLSSPWVSAVSFLPVAGDEVRSVRAGIAAALHLAAATDSLVGFFASDRPPFFDADRRLDPDALRLLGDAVDAADTEVSAALLALAQAPTARIDLVADAVAELRVAARTADSGLAGVDMLNRRLIAAATGGEPLRILILFENGAELRATGGFMGFFATVVYGDSGFSLEQVGPIGALHVQKPGGGFATVDAPDEFETRYGVYLANTALWSNVNLSPHFPWVGQVAADLYAEATGVYPDLVVRADLVAIGDLLAVLPPSVMEGLPYRPEQLATDFVYDSYVRFPDSSEQNTYLATVVGEVFTRALGIDDLDTRALLDTAADDVLERHLAVYAADPTIERGFGVIRADGALQPGDPGQVDVVVQNFGANKLDLFTETSIAVSLADHACAMVGEVTTTLRNTADAAALALPSLHGSNTGQWWVNVYLPRDATVLDILVDGEPAPGSVQTELGRPVAAKIVRVEPGTPVAVTVRWLEPLTGPSYELRMVPQPLVRPATLYVDGFDPRPFLRSASFEVTTACRR